MAIDNKSMDRLLNNIGKLFTEVAELKAEKEKYKYLYQKALDNTIMSDRELIKFKNTTREIRSKIEFDYNYCLDDITADLNKLLGDE